MALRLHNRRWYPPIFLIGFATATAAWLSFPTVRRPESSVSAIGGVTGFTNILYRHHLEGTMVLRSSEVTTCAR